MVQLRILVAVLACLVLVKCYDIYRDKIPNGRQVPDPCNPGGTWQGVGHLLTGGRGQRNQFGKDFALNNYQWNRVCRMDSDDDGKTNGQELGDPNCIWSEGDTPHTQDELSNPGFCDPIDDPKCSNSPQKVSCDSELHCPAIKQPEVRTRTLRFLRTKIPNAETNYYCMTFDLDQDQDYHMIATKPEIDNVDVMHHMLLYGCTDEAPRINSPTKCGMSQEACQELIGAWALGGVGQCFHDNSGFRLGRTGYKTVLLEFHWNNPEKRNDFTDASGLTIYFTPRLRPYDSGTFWTGEKLLEIPPGRERVVVESTCPADCTKKIINGSIFFTQATNHMHYRGLAMSIEMLKANGERRYLTNEPDFDYDSPTWATYNTPIEFNPGDELKTTCVFQSMKDKKTTFYGEGTNDEMCFGFITYYPKSAALSDLCVSSGGYHFCRDDQNGYYGDCHMTAFWNVSHPETAALMDEVLKNCNVYGSCLNECPGAIQEAMRHPCLRGVNHVWVLRNMATSGNAKQGRFAAALNSCSCDVIPYPEWPTASSTSSSVSLISLFVVCVGMIL